MFYSRRIVSTNQIAPCTTDGSSQPMKNRTTEPTAISPRTPLPRRPTCPYPLCCTLAHPPPRRPPPRHRLPPRPRLLLRPGNRPCSIKWNHAINEGEIDKPRSKKMGQQNNQACDVHHFGVSGYCARCLAHRIQYSWQCIQTQISVAAFVFDRAVHG